MIKTIQFAFALLPLLVSAAPASPVTQGSQLVSPYGILKVKTGMTRIRGSDPDGVRIMLTPIGMMAGRMIALRH
jgi:hypothetical protein